MLSAESSMTQWLFLYENILDGGYIYSVKPWHQLNFRVGVGYTFDPFWKKKQKPEKD